MSRNLTNRYEFLIYPQDVDAGLRLRVTSTENLLLNVAGMAARDRGFGSTGMMEQGVTWVLSRLSWSLSELPAQYEKVMVETWVEDYGRLVTTRNFLILSSDGRQIGQARSLWALIDMQTRRPVDMPAQHPDLLQYATGEGIELPRPGKIGEVHGEVIAEHVVAYSDVDFNGHANSVRYVEWLMDSLPVELIHNHGVRHFEVNYLHEALLGQRVGLRVEHRDGLTLMEAVGADGRAMCRARIDWD